MPPIQLFIPIRPDFTSKLVMTSEKAKYYTNLSTECDNRQNHSLTYLEAGGVFVANILGIGMQHCFAFDLFMTVTQFRFFYVLG
jgi:hypothetical protein